MKRTVFVSVSLFLLGALFVWVPFHVEFTGYVLILLGAGILLCGILRKKKKAEGFMHFLIWAMCICSGLLAAAMLGIELYGAKPNPAPKGEYAVVLGAQVQGTQPSRTLAQRLNRALEFMQEHPDVPVIVSGGQGTDESASEASVMYDYLVARGADASRLYREEAAHNTRENLRFSAEIAAALGCDPKKVTVITSEYHQCRTAYIARTLGMEADGVSSRTQEWFLRLNYDLREVFSFVKAVAVAGRG